MILKSLVLIISESFKWRNRPILENHNSNGPKLTLKIFINNNVIWVISGILFSLFFNDLINNDFAANMVTSLSVFVGLFTTTLILIFDKYIYHYKINDLKEITAEVNLGSLPSDLDTNLLRTKNFSKKFVFISLESLLIAIVCIILLMFPMMIGDDFSEDILGSKLVQKNITFFNLLLFIKNAFILFVRASVFILLFKYFKYMFYIFGALGDYIKGVFDDNIKENSKKS